MHVVPPPLLFTPLPPLYRPLVDLVNVFIRCNEASRDARRELTSLTNLLNEYRIRKRMLPQMRLINATVVRMDCTTGERCVVAIRKFNL